MVAEGSGRVTSRTGSCSRWSAIQLFARRQRSTWMGLPTRHEEHRMTVNGSLDAVVEQLSEHAEWHAWVLEYGITHHQMVLALHPGTYPRTAKLGLLDCVYLSGDLQGGPYALTLSEVNQGNGLWQIRSADASFRVVFGAARLIQAL